MEQILSDLAANRQLLHRLRQQGMSYARECLTWDAKAQSHYAGVELGGGARPETRPSHGQGWLQVKCRELILVGLRIPIARDTLLFWT